MTRLPMWSIHPTTVCTGNFMADAGDQYHSRYYGQTLIHHVGVSMIPLELPLRNISVFSHRGLRSRRQRCTSVVICFVYHRRFPCKYFNPVIHSIGCASPWQVDRCLLQVSSPLRTSIAQVPPVIDQWKAYFSYRRLAPRDNQGQTDFRLGQGF